MAFRSSSKTDRDGAGDLIPTAPAGVVSGDYLSAFVQTDGLQTITWPSGWTMRQRVDLSLDVQRGEYGDTIATGSDSYTWTVTGVNGSQVMVCAHSGRNTAAPRTDLQFTDVDSGANSPVSASLTGVTAVSEDDIVAYMFTDNSGGTDTWEFSLITNYTIREQGVARTYCGGGALQTRDNVSAGATGSLATTITQTLGSNNTAYGAVVVAIAAAAGGTDARKLVRTFLG